MHTRTAGQHARRCRLAVAGAIARPDPKQRYHYRTAPPGIAVGLTGAASIGVGLWWWLRRHDERSAPAVSLGASHAVLGWSGQF